MKPTIYVDIGNSYLKIGTLTKFPIWQTVGVWKTSQLLTPTEINYRLITKLGVLPHKVILSCVVPVWAKVWKDWCQKNQIRLMTLAKDVTPPRLFKDPTFDTSQLGDDLFAISLYAGAKWENIIVINFGTAITLTWIKDRKVQGYIIAPNYVNSANALFNSATLLTSLGATYQPSFQPSLLAANNTRQAIDIGVINFCWNAIYYQTQKMQSVSKNSVQIVATGYLAQLFKGKIKKNGWIYNPHFMWDALKFYETKSPR